MELPRFILLKSNANNKFLCYSKEKGPNHAFLRFTEEEKEEDELPQLEKANGNGNDNANGNGSSMAKRTEFHYLKFEVEKAKTVEGLVHIKTCYNNKYWVRKSEDTNWIVAEASEPEEDQSKWSCTLFKPIFLDANLNSDEFISHDTKPQRIQLVHVDQFGQRYIGTSKTRGTQEFDLAVGDPESDLDARSDSGVTFTVRNVEPTAILPEYLTFMGHNGKYLATTKSGKVTYMEFKANSVGEQGVAHWTPNDGFPGPETLPILEKSTQTSWGVDSSNFIVLMSPSYTSYSAIKVGNQIALHCSKNNMFVKCGAGKGMDHCLGASTPTISDDALLKVGEPVLLREILEATYDLADSRIYNTSNVEKYSDSRSNNTSSEQTGTFEVEYKASQTMTWTQSVSVNIGISVSWSAGIPFLGEWGVEVGHDRTETWEYGEEKSEEKTIKYTQNITIPPRKKVTMKVVGMKGYCDVPFTCRVHDTMTDGTVREYTKTDGLYVGCNEFKFETLLDEQDL